MYKVCLGEVFPQIDFTTTYGFFTPLLQLLLESLTPLATDMYFNLFSTKN